MSSLEESPNVALTTIYQADQARISAIGSVALTLLGGGLTYVVTTTAFAQTLAENISKLYGDNPHLGHRASGIFLAALPSLLWVVAAYHSLLTVEAMARTVSARVIEEELTKNANVQVKRRIPPLGFEASNKVMDFKEAFVFQRLASLVAYVGIFAVILGYTAGMIALAGRYIIVLPAIIAYSVPLVIVIGSWYQGLHTIGQWKKQAGLLEPED